MKTNTPSIRVQHIDHCDVVVGIIDYKGLVEEINPELEIHPQEMI